jgi:hypothetical protein
VADEKLLCTGSYSLDAMGDVCYTSQGGSVILTSAADRATLGVQLLSDTFISAQCGAGVLVIEDTGDIRLTSGPESSIVAAAGLPNVGPMIEMTATSLKLSMGPPGVGPSIELTPTGITLKFGLTEWKLSAAGIEESLAAVSRKLGPTGHTLAAAESTVKCAVEGVTISGPLVKTNADALLQVQATVGKLNYDAIKTEKATLVNIN